MGERRRARVEVTATFSGTFDVEGLDYESIRLMVEGMLATGALPNDAQWSGPAISDEFDLLALPLPPHEHPLYRGA